jgi:hypothetical protein
MLVEHGAGAGMQEVGEAELGDAAALPALPRLVGVGGGRLGVALEDGDVVALPGQHDRAGETAHSGAKNENAGHRASLSYGNPHCKSAAGLPARRRFMRDSSAP